MEIVYTLIGCIDTDEDEMIGVFSDYKKTVATAKIKLKEYGIIYLYKGKLNTSDHQLVGWWYYDGFYKNDN